MFQIHCHRQNKVIRHLVLKYHYFIKNVGGAEDLNCLMFTCNTCSKTGTVDVILTIPSGVWSLEDLLVNYPVQNIEKRLLNYFSGHIWDMYFNTCKKSNTKQ